jgi:hypothetical protein
MHMFKYVELARKAIIFKRGVAQWDKPKAVTEHVHGSSLARTGTALVVLSFVFVIRVYTSTVYHVLVGMYHGTIGPYLNSDLLFVFWPKTNRKNLPVPILAQNWAKFALLKC